MLRKEDISTQAIIRVTYEALRNLIVKHINTGQRLPELETAVVASHKRMQDLAAGYFGEQKEFFNMAAFCMQGLSDIISEKDKIQVSSNYYEDLKPYVFVPASNFKRKREDISKILTSRN